ncbi:MAG TPA: hypothetical protein VJ642_03570 [Chromobacteriaceae bacterium]|nr:hypothetical protein [Chromobacteriaceae bacterium]
MGLALNKLLEQMEARRCCCLGTECVTHVEAVRTLEIPISGEVCTELRAMAEVFNAQPAELAGAILQAALIDMQEHLNEEMGHLADDARHEVDDPCVLIASETI